MKLNSDIQNNYELFIELKNGKKLLSEKIIRLNSEKQNNKEWYQNELSLKHSVVEDEVKLIIEKKVSLYKYNFKLRYQKLTPPPFLRFDSDGPAHRNIDKKNLVDQVVTTPHFNTFDSIGREIAYKTDVLENDNEAKAICNDIEFGLSHFLDESNIIPEDQETYPKVELYGSMEFYSDESADPFKNLNF